MPVTLRGVAIALEGDLTPEFVGKVIGEAMATAFGVPRTESPLSPVALPAPDAQPTAEKLIEAAPDISAATFEKPTFEKPPHEEDGFLAAEPAPATPSFVQNEEKNARVKKLRVTRKTPGGPKPAGALGARIVSLLDKSGGVASFAHVRSKLPECLPQALNMAITKCEQLQRLEDGRIALAGYHDED